MRNFVRVLLALVVFAGGLAVGWGWTSKSQDEMLQSWYQIYIESRADDPLYTMNEDARLWLYSADGAPLLIYDHASRSLYLDDPALISEQLSDQPDVLEMVLAALRTGTVEEFEVP